jgi:gamma-glutamylcyclotransferase (GGCT)/AIG2-like uncharacterized protein YtfP
MLDSIFVYGTLKSGHLRASMWPCEPLSIRPATIRAELYDTGPFPAILAGEDDVLGELWTLKREDVSRTLRVLDEVEGFDASRQDNLYVRIETIAILQDGTSIRAYAYQYASGQANRSVKMRCIQPFQEFAGRRCASWPDAAARVPKSFADE